MGQTIDIIGKTLQDIYLSRINLGNECRLIVPGITKSISFKLFETINSYPNINCYLVLETGALEIDPEAHIISPAHLTQKRINSLIAICSPGVIPSLNDSEKGEGAPFKDMAYDEEWPWQRNSMNEFRWDDFLMKFLPNDISQNDRKWFIEIVNQVIPTYSSLSLGIRESYLFDNVLDKIIFKENFKECILKNFYLPYTDDINIIDANKYIEQYKKLATGIIEKIETKEFRRENWVEEGIEKVSDQFKHLQSKQIRFILNKLLDCLYFSKDLPFTVLFADFFSFQKEYWNIFNTSILKDLFNIIEAPESLFSIDNIIIKERSEELNSIGNSLEVVCFQDEILIIQLSFEIEINDEVLFQCKIGRKIVFSEKISTEQKHITKEIRINNDVISSKRQKVVFSLSNIKWKLHLTRSFNIHILSEKRRALAVIKDENKLFEILDFSDEEEIFIETIGVEYSSYCYFFFYKEQGAVFSEDEIELTDSTKVYRINESFILLFPDSSEGLVPQNEKDGRIYLYAKSHNNRLDIELTSKLTKNGNYSLFEEYIEAIKTKNRRKIKSLIESLENQSIYTELGSLSNPQSQRRLLASCFENIGDPFNHYPVLFSNDANNFIQLDSNLKLFGDKNSIPPILNQNFELSSNSQELLYKYKLIKNKIIQYYIDYFQIHRADRPLYAIINFSTEKDILRDLIIEYSEIYIRIIENIKSKHNEFSTIENILLCNLDSVIVYLDHHEAAIFRGPWHPLNLVTNVLLFDNVTPLLYKAERNDGFKNENYRFISLLQTMNHLSWDYCFNGENRNLRRAFTASTNDIGFKYLASLDQKFTLDELKKKVAFFLQSFGLYVNFYQSSEKITLTSILKHYLKSYPWKKRILFILPESFISIQNFSQVTTEITKSAKSEENSVDLNNLIGGIHLFTNNLITDSEVKTLSLEESNFYLYRHEAKNINDYEYDIEILEEKEEIVYSLGGVEQLRGSEERCIFKVPLVKISTGMDGLPEWEVHENECNSHDIQKNLIANAFLKIQECLSFFGNGKLIYKISLPYEELLTNWAVLPGSLVDPLVINEYLKQNSRRNILWDFKIKFDSSFNSYYIISQIRPSLILSLKSSKIFANLDEEYITNLIIETSKIGISLGQEVLMNDKKSSGAIGLLSAVNVFTKGTPIFINNETSVGFLISVDSFEEILGKSASDDASIKRYCDFVGIQLVNDVKGLTMSVVAIECKHSLTTYTDSKVSTAIDEQAQASYQRLYSLIHASSGSDGIVERLALLQLIDYGMKVNMYATNYRSQYNSIIINLLDGRLFYKEPLYSKILFITEPNSSETNYEYQWGSDSLVLRFSPSNWPYEGLKSSKIHNIFNSLLEENTHQVPYELPASFTTGAQLDNKDYLNIIIEEEKNDQSVNTENAALLDNLNVDYGIRFKVGDRIKAVYSEKELFFNPSNTSLNQLNVGILGNLGTGKTQLIKSLIFQISRYPKLNRGLSPKFLIIDTKRDYDGSGDKESDKMFVDLLDAKVIKPNNIPLNLFDIRNSKDDNPALTKAEFFIDVLKKIYGGIGPKQESNLLDAVILSFENKGYKPFAEDYKNFISPTIKDIFKEYCTLTNNAKDAPYSIMNRLIKASFFNDNPTDAQDFKHFFNKNVILSLGGIASNDSHLRMVILIFLNLFREYMLSVKKEPFIEKDGFQLRKIDSFILIDEANLVMDFELPVLEDILLKGREFGIGVILSSQYLSHFRKSGKDYSQPLLTWFIHNVPNISKTDLTSLGIEDNGSKSSEIVKLEKHFCLYKSLNANGEFMRATPFFELI